MIHTAASIRQMETDSNANEDDPEDLDSPVCIEASLSIESVPIKAPQKELWERPLFINPYLLPRDGAPRLVFDILSAQIMPTDDDDVKIKRYVIYNITVRQDTIYGIDNQPASIQRRYTDFRNLYISLKRDYGEEMTSVDFPNKVFMGNFSASLIAERSAAFEAFLIHIFKRPILRESLAFLSFLQDQELHRACQLLDERNDSCVPILENSFLLLNKIFMDRSRPVLLVLCRLVAACTYTPMPHASADKWATLALNRYATLCDIDLLPLYVPLLNTCAHLWWQRGRNQKPITDRLQEMAKKGININNVLTLTQAIHKLDPRSETI